MVTDWRIEAARVQGYGAGLAVVAQGDNPCVDGETRAAWFEGWRAGLDERRRRGVRASEAPKVFEVVIARPVPPSEPITDGYLMDD